MLMFALFKKKNEDTHDPIDYIPISVTCICCQILVHVISSNTMTDLVSNTILFSQF